MGIDVHLIDNASRVLPAEQPDASAIVLNALLREGVETHLGTRIGAVEKIGSQIRLDLGDSELRVKRVLVAAGRQANVESLDLDVAGVDLTEGGLIRVNDYLRSTNSRIYAAGDVCSQLQFTHHADAQARIVLQNALFLPTARATRLVIPHCTYTAPEVAQVGATREALEQGRVQFEPMRVDLGELDRGLAAGELEHFAELLVAPRSGAILGATIVAESAGELIVPVCVAMSNGLGLTDLGKTVIPYPTRSEYLRRIADGYNRKRLTPTLHKLIRAWLRLTS